MAEEVLDRLGRPLRDLRISVTDRCNFRCPFCMPAEVYGASYPFLPRSELLTFEEIARLTRILVGLGVRKVRLTGGEPLLRKGLETLVAMLAGIPGLEDIALTTNGVLLAQKARALRDAGLRRVTVSLHSLDERTFGQLNGRGAPTGPVLRGMEVAHAVGLRPVKVNAVIIRGVNEDAILPLARFCRERGYTLRFIEYMDVGTLNGWRMDRVVPAREILARLQAEFPLEPVEKDYRGEVAERYRYADGKGEVGLIASVTQPFCGDCTRLRLTADGKLVTCLFAEDGFDLKTPLRSGATDEDLRGLIVSLWRRREDRYSELRARLLEQGARPRRRIEMFQVGG